MLPLAGSLGGTWNVWNVQICEFAPKREPTNEPAEAATAMAATAGAGAAAKQ